MSIGGLVSFIDKQLVDSESMAVRQTGNQCRLYLLHLLVVNHYK